MKIEGTVSLVTGGASGIGRAVCRSLLRRGAKVVFLDLNETACEETQKIFDTDYPGQAKFVLCDVTSHDQLEGIVDERDWERTLGVNLNAVIRGTFLGIELMKNGVIINVSSTGGIHPISACPVYCASKFGVVGFTRSVAPPAFNKKGIPVNCVCPGNTDTNISKAVENLELTKKQEELVSNAPKQRPEVVAQCIVDLIEDESEKGAVVKVTQEDGVEYLNYNDIVI